MFLYFLYIIIYYIIKKNFPLFVLHKDLSFNNKVIKVLTYNVQRLPFLFRPCININDLLNKYDVICLQENYCDLFKQNNSYNVNCVIPKSSIFKIADSGLTIYSKLPIHYIDFIRFENLCSIDRVADKGFLIVQINDFILINTHLQASYNLTDNNNFTKAEEQIKTIINKVKNHNKIIICGDFNYNINEIEINDFNNICPNVPTHWMQMGSILSKTSATKINNYYPYYFDGALYKNININNINVENYDNYTDHLGVSFDIIL
jgi:exonuclease III